MCEWFGQAHASFGPWLHQVRYWLLSCWQTWWYNFCSQSYMTDQVWLNIFATCEGSWLSMIPSFSLAAPSWCHSTTPLIPGSSNLSLPFPFASVPWPLGLGQTHRVLLLINLFLSSINQSMPVSVGHPTIAYYFNNTPAGWDTTFPAWHICPW